MREGELLAYIYQHNRELMQQGGAQHAAGGAQPTVLIPPGDDMALVRVGPQEILIATDQVIEGRHFVSGTPMRAVGRKAVLRNLSDVAAMAGTPIACVAAVVLPQECTAQAAKELYDGLHSAAQEWKCPLVGGDTSVHGAPKMPLVLTVSIMATPGPSGRVVKRKGARAGNVLCVTGALGGSISKDGMGRHLEPIPRIPEALGLMECYGAERIHAMIDISDGLGRDASHLATAAGLDIEIDAARVPCNPGCDWRRALSDGEDYELAFACDISAFSQDNNHTLCVVTPQGKLSNTPVTAIGYFVPPKSPGGGAVRVEAGGEMFDASQMGWEHA